MTSRTRSVRRRLAGESARDERGYIAVVTALLLTVFVGLCAFSVDVGRWYFVAMQEQKAADAAALAGVTALPGDPTTAYSHARTYAAANGFSLTLGDSVTPSRTGASRLKVEVTREVDNFFGGVLGVPRTTVSRSAVAEFSGPVPMGSPCNRFGDDPDPDKKSESDNCSNAGAFWANVGSPAAAKSYGDAFQNRACTTESACSAGTNTDYDPNGYTYLVRVDKPVNNLTIEAFDPAQVVVGDACADNTTNRLTAAAALPSNRTVVKDPATRYAAGAGVWCTGDVAFNTGLLRTRFVVRTPGATPWDTMTWPAAAGCSRTFEPYNGDLSAALNKSSAGFRSDVAESFRQWVPLCTFNGLVQPGTYAVQVYTNGLSADGQAGHNRFALRAYGSAKDDADNIAVSGSAKMAMYGNTPGGTSRFYLARVPSGSEGQMFTVNLFDIGDGATAGSTIRVVPPAEVGGKFAGCTGSGVTNGNLVDCTIPVSSAYQGRWQTISVPIPAGYSCDDSDTTGCWVRLEFFYGGGSQPADTTSWTASLGGDPIRLVE